MKYLRQASIIILITVIVLPSCQLRRSYRRPAVNTDSLYRDVTSRDTGNMGNISWKAMFKDPSLQSLLKEGIANNDSLKIAVTRINQAEANLRQSNAAFFPTVSVEPEVTQERIAGAAGGALGIFPNRIYELSGSASWEADLWGKLKGAKKAALASLLQSYAYKRAVQTQVVVNIALDYYNLLAYDKELAITRQTVDSYMEDVKTNKALKQANKEYESSVAQSEANLYSAEVVIPGLQNSIRREENALCILIGRQPSAIKRDSLNDQTLDTLLQTGLPAQILDNRPDVREAEYNVMYYFEQINVAKAYFYPTLTITAQGGWESATVGTLFSTASIFGNVVAGLTQPILNHGLNKQRLRIAQAQYDEYVITFQQTVLNAGRDVSNALYSYQSATNTSSVRALQLDALKRAVDYNRKLLKGSYVNYTDVLTSEQGYLSAQLNSVSDKLQQLSAIVSLYQSLGGGWK
jgi:outer membrane protein, multidrug efflux system